MAQSEDRVDQLFLTAEKLAKDFSLASEKDKAQVQDHVKGLLAEDVVRRQCEAISELDIDSYIERCVAPAEAPGRMSAKSLIPRLGSRVTLVEEDGPFYSAVVTMAFPQGTREVGFIAQDRSVANGVWMPRHHLAAARRLEMWSKRNMPVVSFMDTPGADAGAEANAENQAHSISRLIAEMCNVDVPTVGIILGIGYSGGAIPLAASNLILAVRDAVFNTIQPKGLANIARKYNLSWQECAKLVGVSSYDLYAQGNIDGIIDYVPGEDDAQLEKLRASIVTGVEFIENKTRAFVAENPYIIDHYRRNLDRYLNPSARLHANESTAALSLATAPTEFSNVFGVAYRYLRYLGVRKRIRSTTTKQYGRLAEAEVPKGELAQRSDRERRRAFLSWFQDPEKLVYDDGLARAWKNYQEKKQAVHDERGRLAQLIFGEPKKNYEDARAALLSTVLAYLYNRWKNEARGNLEALMAQLADPAATHQLLRVADLPRARDLLVSLRSGDNEVARYLREHFSFDARKLLSKRGLADKSDGYLQSALAAELNVFLQGVNPFADDALPLSVVPEALRDESLRTAAPGSAPLLAALRGMLAAAFEGSLQARGPAGVPVGISDLTLLDVLLTEELREDFIAEGKNLLLFDALYDAVLQNLDLVAEEANEKRALSYDSMAALMDRALKGAAAQLRMADSAGLADVHFAWLEKMEQHGRRGAFLRTVEEWKKASFPHLSDTLLVVVTFLFDRLIPVYGASVKDGRRYDGRIAPQNIGRRKDFWYRLTLAYRDLLIQEVLSQDKRKKNTTPEAFVDRYFHSFTPLHNDRLSSDPVRFPGFRVSIEQALEGEQIPCGIVTGLGEFKGEGGPLRCGVVISNVAFQAGSFDMASAEKFCELLVTCAEQRLPVLCFISSGGMQTKEGAGALFSMAAVNDRITRFVRDIDLPVVVFGFGDCTGGAQASFVTHPLVQTYYFSGTNMPFAGQIVVPSNLPSHCTLSNYLSRTSGAMQGLVRHPFSEGLDGALAAIDPDIPVPTDSVEGVVARVMAGIYVDDSATVAEEVVAAAGSGEPTPVKRTLIHARGCTAAKLVRVARAEGIEVVLVQSDPDMESPAADMLGPKDRLVCIGGNTPDESYLNGLSVVRVAELEKVDSLHPGIGFLSENAQFAELCRNHGINFIGPPVTSMETMGNKSNAISTARSLGVPVVPGSYGILTSVERAAQVAEDIGYPVLIKAVHGGGGKGIQVVESPEAFHDLFHQVQAEARNAFGNGDVYLEKFVTSMRHIEAQLLRDHHGNAFVLGIRDCSVQRDKQKVVEESGSTALTPALEAQVRESTLALAHEVDYVGAGTVEFILDVVNDAVYFMEMNTRLQVEHPVTEKVCGVDIVAEQFRVAGGASIKDLTPGSNGYSIEVRLNAEKVTKAGDKLVFRPDPGEISEWVMPDNEAIDIIAAGGPGKVISPFYDSMVAQIIIHGTDRRDAAGKLAAYLDSVRVKGICTNLALLRKILRDEVFLSGDYDTSYLPNFLATLDADALIEEIEKEAGKDSSVVSLEALAIEGSDELKVLSPSTGIFYITPSPSEPEYVAVGEEVSVGKTLCQLEAMKIFSPLTLASFNQAEQALYPEEQRYVVTRINIANGQQVNAGDLLFVVKPKPALESAA